MGQGLYIHIPFCESKCGYCAFNSRPVRGGVPDDYIDALLADAGREAGVWADRDAFDSVFFGGGTPSLLSAEQMKRLLGILRADFRLSSDAEITIECNPNTVNREILSAYVGLGINRISLGIQSLRDCELRFLGRAHTRVDAMRALDAARSVCGAGLSADLIAGIPGQRRESLAGSIETVAGYADHVSVYLLSIEPGTALDRMVRTGEVKMPGEEETVGLYDAACSVLEAAGFRRYEISNWCRPGAECIHNLLYWRRGDYLGLGAGAHSHAGGLRYAKVRDPLAYARALAVGGDGIAMRERLGPFQMFVEDLMLGLRTDRGIDPAVTAAGYGIDPRAISRRFDDLLEAGYICKRDNRVLLSAKGMMLHDAIAGDLVSAAQAF